MSRKRNHKNTEINLEEKVDYLEKTVLSILTQINNIGNIRNNSLEKVTNVSMSNANNINYLHSLINTISENLTSSRDNQDGTITVMYPNGNTLTINQNNGNRTETGENFTNTIGNRLIATEDRMTIAEENIDETTHELEGTDGMVHDINLNVDTMLQDINNLKLKTGTGGYRQQNKTNR